MPPLLIELLIDINKMANAALDAAEANLAESVKILEAIGGSTNDD